MTGRHPTDTQETLAHTPLWSGLGQATKPPRPEIHFDKIVETAIILADNAGIDALTMRKVALAMDVGTMTLYTYLPGKTELMAAMVESVYGHTNQDPPCSGGWRLQLANLARQHLNLHRRHRWLLAIPDQIRTTSRAVEDHRHTQLTALGGVGLSDDEKHWLVDLVNGHVLACAGRARVAPPRDTEQDFEFGLQRILEGTAALIRSRS